MTVTDSDIEIDEQVTANLGIEDEECSDIEIVEVQPSQEEHEFLSKSQSSEDTQSPATATVPALKTMRCPICLETPEIVAVAACGHPYCHECIFPALSSSRLANRREGQCSLCRKCVRYDQVIFMELKVRHSSLGSSSDTPPIHS